VSTVIHCSELCSQPPGHRDGRRRNPPAARTETTY